ncbi:MAG: cyclic nucleotide-binding domain-containing protein [Gemmatimonadetes bacterium]|nr:cyclic nucleotide-binding domain-containing protein [Gemmatimonadota bacterium]NNF12235.1 cyclic nucleotide-binding domain-containing protein [Gemmatimonadota bacterium]
MDPTPTPVVSESAPPVLTREQISVRLREVALFQGLSQDDLSELLGISEAVRVDAGEYVFEEGERGDHFYVIVHGSIELRKATGSGFKKLAIMKAGQAFGEMALLNQTPRSASAYALEDTYLLSVSRAAFAQMLGGDTLSVRLLKNLSKALWATSVRLAAQNQTRGSTDHDTGHETLAEFNRLLRARLLPRVTPRVSGYDIAAATLAPRQGSGATAWDWFVLTDGRPAFAVMKAVKNDIFAAQRLAAARMLLRSLAAEPQPSLGSLLTKTSRGLRAGWIEGLSGPVMVGIVALADGAGEWAEAGAITALVVRRDGAAEDLSRHAPPLGEDGDRNYESEIIVMAEDDCVVALTDGHSDAAASVTEALEGRGIGNARDGLSRVVGRASPADGSTGGSSDVSASIIRRTAPSR